MSYTSADLAYFNLLGAVTENCSKIKTNNHEVIRNFRIHPMVFSFVPLVTVRKTAWKKALREMQWFLSGKSVAPDEFAQTWWKGQLNTKNQLINGYSMQLRDSSCWGGYEYHTYDQITNLIKGLRHNPYSRRLVTSTWNPGEMAYITRVNDNPNTPTSCHGVYTQYFVESGELHINTIQRSADCLLGVQHNWIQYWAVLLWLAKICGLKPGSLQWQPMDAHIYLEESHLAAVDAIINIDKSVNYSGNDFVQLKMTYEPDFDVNSDDYAMLASSFNADHFQIIGEIPEPSVHTKPKLIMPSIQTVK